jgi:hypothetical protein
MASHKSDDWYLEQARATKAVDGEIEFDDDAAISANDDPMTDHGAYVQGWFWVSDPEEFDGHECGDACDDDVSMQRPSMPEPKRLARDVLVIAALGGMPDTFWGTDSRIARASATLGWSVEEAREWARAEAERGQK